MEKMQPPDLSCHFCLSPNAVRPPPYDDTIINFVLARLSEIEHISAD